MNKEFVTIAVDVQNDFCQGGSLAVPFGDEVVPVINKLTEQTREKNGTVIFTRDWHPAETAHFDNWPVHCVKDTTGASFHPDLEIYESDLIVSKGTAKDEDGYSGFDGQTVAGQTINEIITSKAENASEVVVQIGGLATDYCVKATVLDALKLKKKLGKKLSVIAITNAIKAVNVNENDGNEALAQMHQAGAEFLEFKD
jgi:nicotinamidase/pyrazinamidase